jgi:hypothetical protein
MFEVIQKKKGALGECALQVPWVSKLRMSICSSDRACVQLPEELE